MVPTVLICFSRAPGLRLIKKNVCSGLAGAHVRMLFFAFETARQRDEQLTET